MIFRLLTVYKERVISQLGINLGLLLLLMLGLLGVVAWQASQPIDTSDLLVNPDFKELAGWQVAFGGVQIQPRLAAYPPDNQALVLEIPDSSGGWVGVGQRVPIDPVKIYEIKTNFRLARPIQSSDQLVVRISQFDKTGALLTSNEFAFPGALMTSPPPSGQAAWQAANFSFISHWRAASVEAGIGLLGQQATTVEVDDLALQVAPTWLNAVRSSPLALASLLVIGGLAGAMGWTYGRRPVSGFINRLIDLAQRKRSIWREVGWAGLFYLGLTVALTYPVSWQISKAVAGSDNLDPLQFVWYQWWIKRALLVLGVWPDQAQSLFYPLVVTHPILALHSYVPFTSLPLTLVWGPLVSYNLAFLLSFVLSGSTCYLLCRYLGCRPGAALVGGLIFAFYPNRVGHAEAGHITYTTNYFLPLYVLSLLILLKRPTTRHILWFGVVTMMLAWANPMHIGYAVIPIFLFVVAGNLWRTRGSISASWERLKGVSLTLIPAILLAILLYLPFAWSTLWQGPGFLDVDNYTDNSTDLLAFILPSPYHPLLRKLDLAPQPSLLGITPDRDLGEPLAYLGLVPVGLAVVAISRRWHTSRLWLMVAIVCAVLSMGAILKIGTQLQGVSLPYSWLVHLPFYGWSRTPGRLIETTMVGLAILAALGMDYLLGSVVESAGRRVLGYGCLVLAAILILTEYWVIYPFPTDELPVSAYYHSLADEPITGGVLELMPRRISDHAMYYQTIHEHPLAGGYISRAPQGTAEYRRFLHQFLWPWPSQSLFPPLGVDQIRAILADMKIDRVIAQRESMTGDSGTATLNYLPVLFGSPVFEDEYILAYRVPSRVEGELPALQLMPDQKNWSVIQDGTSLSMEPKGNIYIYAARAGAALLELQLAPSSSTIELNLALNDTSVEPELTSTTEPAMTFPLSLRAGFNYIRLSTDASDRVEFKKISIKDLNR
jgi:hypothetical protein